MSKGDITKKAISNSFKSLMETKPFEHITVSEIAEGCNLTRLAFYYHFEDKYSLLNWIFYTEIIEPFRDGLHYDTWPAKLEKALTIMKESKKFYRNAFDYDEKEFTRYLSAEAAAIICLAIDDMVKDQFTIDEKDKAFVSEFFAFGVTGTVALWAKRGMPDSPKKIARRVKNLVEDSKVIAISRYLKTFK
ncbi:MAG: dihydroxyacetone kinase transcriptional activator DhaS [Anaerovoracaceae bacterium]